jgi:hypothetical protein
MNKQPLSKQERVLRALTNSSLLLVQPGFPVEQRTIFGLCGDDSDLAVSIKWHDSTGCKWAANFTEESLSSATVAQNQITLKDSEDEAVCVEFYDLKAGDF